MELIEFIDHIVHEPTQTEGPGLDVTVDTVTRITDSGSVDFGGGELAPAETEAVSPERREPGDDYGWWKLSDGVYRLGYNEELDAPTDRSFVLQTREAVRHRGAFHPTLRLSGGASLEGVPLIVGESGIGLKENARVSTLLSV